MFIGFSGIHLVDRRFIRLAGLFSFHYRLYAGLFRHL